MPTKKNINTEVLEFDFYLNEPVLKLDIKTKA